METQSTTNNDDNALKEFLESVKCDTPYQIYNPGDLTAIYHYTDLTGLKGIIEEHDLRLTHSRYSNDEEELTHGLQIVKKVIEEKHDGDTNPEYKKYLKHIYPIRLKPLVSASGNYH